MMVMVVGVLNTAGDEVDEWMTEHRKERNYWSSGGQIGGRGVEEEV